MDLHERIYRILTIEVERLEHKQKAEGLDKNDVGLLSTLTNTAANIGKAAPPEPEPTEGMTEEELLAVAGSMNNATNRTMTRRYGEPERRTEHPTTETDDTENRSFGRPIEGTAKASKQARGQKRTADNKQDSGPTGQGDEDGQ